MGGKEEKETAAHTCEVFYKCLVLTASKKGVVAAI